MPIELKRMDRVRKHSGHAFDGVVVAVYETLSGDTRVVVENETYVGWQMIFRPDQLERVDAD